MIALIIFCFIIILNLTINFLINAGLVWILCWALPLIGITTIGSWPIVFSWPLVIVLTIVLTIFRTSFSIKIDTK